ncbi:hypothetical protein ARMGADRAFT_1071415 [Armillaria gallica]|uniref:Uncharacterized protein n=1 Tax=Armillaria gallica TaxID=47427 RepID=A0A2H3E6C7_ARMGA|nr:hypothetical protein ARMGADRAFT_1071415 [Armillaria gallica]
MSDQLMQQFLLQIPVHKLRFLVGQILNKQNKTARKFPLDRDILIGMVEHTQIDWDKLCSPQNAAMKAVTKWLAQPENI